MKRVSGIFIIAVIASTMIGMRAARGERDGDSHPRAGGHQDFASSRDPHQDLVTNVTETTLATDRQKTISITESGFSPT